MTTFTPALLGRKVEHDPKSWDYRVERDQDLKSLKWRTYGAVLDQGNLGSCTGNALAGALNSRPLHKKEWGILKQADAVEFYKMNTTHDEWPSVQYPPTDCGSSGLAAAKTALKKGYITRYEHAMGIDDVLHALMRGPLMTGTYWTSDMERPDGNGLVRPTGRDLGGHEYLVTGLDLKRELVRFRNSWGKEWGEDGHFFMTISDYEALLKRQGDATLLLA